MSINILGVAYYERRSDDLELLSTSLVCDKVCGEPDAEFDCSEDALSALIPKQVGFYVMSFVLRVVYSYDGSTGEYDAASELSWHKISLLDESEVQNLLNYLKSENEVELKG